MNDFKRNDFKQFEQQDVTTDYLGDGVRYRLPRRQLGRVRHLGWVVVVIGIILTLFSIGWISGTVLGMWDELAKGGVGRWVTIGFGCVGLLVFLQGVLVIPCGIAIIGNRTRCDIEVRNGTIAVRERVFLFRPRRKRATSDIQRLRIVTASETLGGKQKHDTRVWLGDCEAALMTETGSDRKFSIAVAYPHDLLVRLAEEIAPKLEADWTLQSAAIEREPMDVAKGEPVRRKIEVVEGNTEQGEFPVVPVQPVNSTATIARRDYGITIEIPPAGVWKGSKGLFVFALIWNAFISIFVVVGTLGATGVIAVEGDAPSWMGLVAILPFVAIGLGMTIAAVNMGRRHATIATADDLVMIVRHSIFGKTTREWSASQIEAICCGNSGMEVNDVPVKELQIIPTGDKKFGCLSQLDDDELVWIAAELNQALAIQRPSDRDPLATTVINRNESGVVTPAPDSRVALERSINGLRIDVPPQGLLKYVGLLVIGLIFAAVGIGVAIAVGWDTLDDGFKKMDFGKLAFASAFLFGFCGFGGAMLLAGLVAGRRRFRLTVEHDELTLLRRGPFGRRTFRWHRDDLESIEVIDSGTKVNNRSLYQIFIRSPKGNSVGIMTGHDSADLGLVATAVQESLGLPENHPAHA